MASETYIVELFSEASKSFYAVKAAQSVDLNIEEKLSHKLEIVTHIDPNWQIAAIVGNSGSGKTTLAHKMFNFIEQDLDLNKTAIDHFDDQMTFDDRVQALCGMGLASVPCWIRPLKTLSTGQRARAKAAIVIAQSKGDVVVLDEWTSTVDRTVAMIMTQRLAKLCRAQNKKVVVVSCHFDILPWLEPDWAIDCNASQFDNQPKYEKKNCFSTFNLAQKTNGECLGNIII